MSVTDPTNEWYSTRQQSALTASPRRGVVLHHGATTSADAIIQMETSGSRQVSSNRVVKDNRCAKIVDESGVRAWSLSSAYWDSVLRSVECANESTAGWTISASSSETIARMVAFWSLQDGFYPHRNGARSTWTVYGHREIYEEYGASYATACPGGMDLNAITTRAQQILAGQTGKKKRMELFLDPTGTKPDGSNRYYVIGNGAPYVLPGNQASANAFVAALSIKTNATVKAADFPQFLINCTPPALTDAQLAKIGAGVKVDLSGVLAAIAGIPALVVAGIRNFWATGK